MEVWLIVNYIAKEREAQNRVSTPPEKFQEL